MKYILILATLATASCYAIQEQKTLTMNIQQNIVKLSVNQQSFDLMLENNDTARAFAHLLPLDLTMQDHLKNEKFSTLPQALPSNDKRAGYIEAGDVMLFQDNTLVIFYENFNSNYYYTRIGTITKTEQLKQLLGNAHIQVRIEKDN
ncbi:cyclophilin-like fold protein [Mannheimia sp. AT1]|uniref:Cyclophilin-like fold protein n=1 Tax=Mannheimia cairinae TaxID=3025936 RepID=A0ABT5MRL7_9PAST|nr:cyclophilin-like fold protein [Mannheimia cairinae]MDD0824815.1 cyclophilin-like fold protein [Mannheimia cairinae]MDD0826255.1 cyclophilin-like fold protein [Mannheimia cairinae]